MHTLSNQAAFSWSNSHGQLEHVVKSTWGNRLFAFQWNSQSCGFQLKWKSAEQRQICSSSNIHHFIESSFSQLCCRTRLHLFGNSRSCRQFLSMNVTDCFWKKCKLWHFEKIALPFDQCWGKFLALQYYITP